jgi:hypothetical protein
MRLFRRTEFDGLVAVTPQDLTSSGAHLLSWKEDALRRRQDNESTNDFPTVPTSLVSTPAVSVASTVPDLPNNAPSVGFSLLDLGNATADVNSLLL